MLEVREVGKLLTNAFNNPDGFLATRIQPEMTKGGGDSMSQYYIPTLPIFFGREKVQLPQGKYFDSIRFSVSGFNSYFQRYIPKGMSYIFDRGLDSYLSKCN